MSEEERTESAKRQREDEGETKDQEGDTEMGVMKVEVNQEEDEDQSKWATDDISGKALDIKLVEEARSEEVGFLKGIDMYDEVDAEECWRLTGKPPVTTKWIDQNKGTDDEPPVRCRLVARDFKTKGTKIARICSRRCRRSSPRKCYSGWRW